MKKIIILMILVLGTMSFSFSQESSTYLLKERAKEIKKVEKQNLPPEEILAEKNAINNFYKPLIDSALAREYRNNTTATSNSSTPPPRTIGANVNLPGFQGGSYRIKDAAISFVMVSDAQNRRMITERQINNQNNQDGKIKANESTFGYEGILMNKYSYRDITITITPNYPGAVGVMHTIKKGETSLLYLLPGEYRYKVVTPGYDDAFGSFSVRPDAIHNIYGKSYFFCVYAGREGF